MSTIDWPTDLSQTYVRVEDGNVVVEDDHQSSGQHTDAHDPVTARQLAAAHRALADALDAAADHIVASRISATYALLERAIAGGDEANIKATAANVRRMIDDVRDDTAWQPAPEPAVEPVIT